MTGAPRATRPPSGGSAVVSLTAAVVALLCPSGLVVRNEPLPMLPLLLVAAPTAITRGAVGVRPRVRPRLATAGLALGIAAVVLLVLVPTIAALAGAFLLQVLATSS